MKNNFNLYASLNLQIYAELGGLFGR